jgi:hypothetical protein
VVDLNVTDGLVTCRQTLVASGRVVMCLGVFQPVLLAALVGRIAGSWEDTHWMCQIGSGAVANYAGMIMYLLFRVRHHTRPILPQHAIRRDL